MNCKKDCKLDLPYPTTETGCINSCCAKLLMPDFAGESTAIHQYLYQHWLLKKCYPELSDLLECTAEVEMKHLGMLGEVIVNFGGDPRLGTCIGPFFSPWCTSTVNHTADVQEMLCANIKAEKEAIKMYKCRQCQIDNACVKALLGRIILDEQHHLELFEDMLKNGPGCCCCQK